MKTKLCLSLALVATLSAFAYDASDYLKWMRLKTTDNSSTESSFTRANWYDPEAEEEVLESVTAGKCYYVPYGLDVWTHKTEGQVFAGDALAVAGLLSFRRYSEDYVVNDLRLLPKGELSYASNARVKGNITIEGTASQPSKINPNTFSDRYFELYSAVSGTADSVVEIGNNADRERGGVYVSPRYRFYSGPFMIRGSWANFQGKITYKKGTHVMLECDDSINGDVEVEGNCILDAYNYSGTHSIRSLTLDNDSELRFCYSNGGTRKFSVSSQLSIPGERVYVSFYSLPATCSVPIITLTGDAALDANLPDVSKLTLQPAMVTSEGWSELPRNSHGVITDNGDGTKTVSIVWDDIYKVEENTVLQSTATTGTITHEYFRFAKDSGIYYQVVAAGSVVYEATKGIEFADDVETVKIGMSDLNCQTRECTIDGTIYQYLDLIKLSGAAAANPPDLTKFVYADEYKLGELPRNPHCVLVDGDDGAKIIRLVWDRIWFMIKANSYKDNQSAFDDGNGSYWHTGELPPEDVDLDMINVATLHFRAYGPVSWPKLTLNCFNYGFYNAARNIYLKKINICGDINLYCAYINDYVPHTIHAPIEIFNKTLTIGGWGNRRNQLNGAISGTGKLSMYHNHTIAQIINGDNSGFHGLVYITGSESNLNLTARHAYSYCQLGNANALGGSYTGDAALGWRAHEFTNVWFTCASDVNLTESTRGVLLTGENTFEVNANKTLTLTEAATYCGTVVKRGEGTLVLGSPSVKFLEAGAQSATPQDGLNALNLAAGALKVTDANAVNGLAVNFASGTKLILDVAATGDLATYGMKNTLWSKPFVGATTVELAGTASDAETTIAVCTITTSATIADFDVPSTYGKRAVTSEWHNNGDGTQTLLVKIAARQGLSIIVK